MENPPKSAFFTDSKLYDKTELLEYDWDTSTIEVPGDWNHQHPKLEYYEGTIWYEKNLIIKKCTSNRVFIHFGAVNYYESILNGTKVVNILEVLLLSSLKSQIY